MTPTHENSQLPGKLAMSFGCEQICLCMGSSSVVGFVNEVGQVGLPCHIFMMKTEDFFCTIKLGHALGASHCFDLGARQHQIFENLLFSTHRSFSNIV